MSLLLIFLVIRFVRAALRFAHHNQVGVAVLLVLTHKARLSRQLVLARLLEESLDTLCLRLDKEPLIIPRPLECLKPRENYLRDKRFLVAMENIEFLDRIVCCRRV